MRKRVVEIKVSDYDALAPMHEVQTLLYALLFGRGWKPTRQFELVRNVMNAMSSHRALCITGRAYTALHINIGLTIQFPNPPR